MPRTNNLYLLVLSNPRSFYDTFVGNVSSVWILTYLIHYVFMFECIKVMAPLRWRAPWFFSLLCLRKDRDFPRCWSSIMWTIQSYNTHKIWRAINFGFRIDCELVHFEETPAHKKTPSRSSLRRRVSRQLYMISRLIRPFANRKRNDYLPPYVGTYSMYRSVSWEEWESIEVYFLPLLEVFNPNQPHLEHLHLAQR